MKNQIYIVLMGTLMALSCKGKADVKEEPKSYASQNSVTLTQPELQNAELQTGIAKDTMVSIEKDLNGIIDVPPQNNVCISFPMGGYLKGTSLLPGKKVKKGENIATMEDPAFIQLQQDYLISVSQQELKEAEYLRQKDLNSTKTTSDKSFQLAKSDYETARITKKALAEKLLILGINPEKLTFENISKNVIIRSPVNGIVSRVNVSVGKYITPNDVMFEIIDKSDIHLKLTAFENDAGNFVIGDEVTAYTNRNMDKKYSAKIISISPSMNETNRSFDIHCHFNEKNEDLMPGMYMNAKVYGGKIHTLIFPENTAVSYGKKDYLFTDKGNYTYEMVEVDIDYRANGMIGISADKYSMLKGESVVVKNSHFLLMKLKNSNE